MLSFKRNKELIIVLCLLLFTQCGTVKNIELSPPKATIDVAAVEEVVYKTTLAKESLKMDIFAPKETDPLPRPAVLFIHGGGWTAGSKEVIKTFYRQYVLKALLEKGYVVASVDYRVISDSIHFPDPIIDCKDAVRWLHKYGAKYNIDENDIGLWGASAGGHLALMTAYTDDEEFIGEPNLEGVRSDVKYVIDNFGPTDLYRLFRPEINPILSKSLKWFANEKYQSRKKKIEQITGVSLGDKDKTTAILKYYSPEQLVNKYTVPTLVMHGNNDKRVPIKQSIILSDALKKNQVSHRLYTYKKAIHGFKNMNMEEIEKVTADMLIFIEEQTEKSKR
ncbi:MAG: hypothetical protein CMH14_09675 [Mesonia sp.]|uniref:Carboxylesterase NlhH n=2 Tax=Flavobacteriaceae TaxID=49546 RepID=A0AC61Y8X8_9FLAO|nr:hypothetical protein [Mesonia sp.]VVV00964.1 Carboxylesterase NlhH [Mesonia oceanica]